MVCQVSSSLLTNNTRTRTVRQQGRQWLTQRERPIGWILHQVHICQDFYQKLKAFLGVCLITDLGSLPGYDDWKFVYFLNRQLPDWCSTQVEHITRHQEKLIPQFLHSRFGEVHGSLASRPSDPLTCLLFVLQLENFNFLWIHFINRTVREQGHFPFDWRGWGVRGRPSKHVCTRPNKPSWDREAAMDRYIHWFWRKEK